MIEVIKKQTAPSTASEVIKTASRNIGIITASRMLVMDMINTALICKRKAKTKYSFCKE